MKKRILGLVLALALVCVCLTGCGGALPKGDIVGERPATGYKVATYNGVSFCYPEGWAGSESSFSESNGTGSNVGIVSTPIVVAANAITKADMKESFDAGIKIAEAMMPGMEMKITIKAFNHVKVDTLEVTTIEIATSVKNNGETAKMKQYAFMFDYSSKQYTITLTLLEDDADMATAILKSIKVA